MLASHHRRPVGPSLNWLLCCWGQPTPPRRIETEGCTTIRVELPPGGMNGAGECPVVVTVGPKEGPYAGAQWMFELKFGFVYCLARAIRLDLAANGICVRPRFFVCLFPGLLTMRSNGLDRGASARAFVVVHDNDRFYCVWGGRGPFTIVVHDNGRYVV